MLDLRDLREQMRFAGSDLRTEVLAGATTFLTMAYILFVQPAVLSRDFAGQPTGMDPQAVFVATCVASAIATAAMGLWARYPIALAPGMGENFFFVTVTMAVAAAGVPDAWQTALGIVFLSGTVFILLSFLRVREAILDGISPSMGRAIACGIGLFIAFIGLKNGGILSGTPFAVGLSKPLGGPDALVFACGLGVMTALHVRRVRGSILLGILAGGLLALALGRTQFAGIAGWPRVTTPAMFRMDLFHALRPEFAWFAIVFLFMDMFDTVGTLVGVSEQAGLMRNGRLPRAGQALMSDAIGTVVGAALGTSTVTSYIESATGVEQGGRTGVTALVTAALFLVSLVFAPLVGMIGQYPPITAPALVIVGVLMLGNARRIDWDDFSEAIPAFLLMAGIPLCFSIADGLALGFVSYPAIKALCGRGREVKPLMYALAFVLFLYLVFVRTRVG